MSDELLAALETFAKQEDFRGKGKLSVAIVVTQHAKTRGLPLDAGELVTGQGGQVLGLGVAAVQSVLGRHGIERILAREGGRTSRGSIGAMQSYVAFLNQLHQNGPLDQDQLDEIETFWVGRVKEFFAGMPFKLRLEAGKGLRVAVRDLLEQAQQRQAESMGMMFVGAVMQHLVGAKLELALPGVEIAQNSFSTSDEQSGRPGDFDIGDTAIHVTVSPSEALIRRCRQNLEGGRRPVIVTGSDGVTAAGVLAKNQGLGDAIDIFEIEQFISLNLYELSKFQNSQRSPTAGELVERYNAIVERYETDPSLKIELQ